MLDESDKKVIEISIKFYESARSELIQRIILRDSALVVYMATVGSYMKYIVDMHYSKDVDIVQAMVYMIPLPVVCLVFALIIVQHHVVIGKIGGFLRHELAWPGIDGRISRHWDNSEILKDNAILSAKQRLCAQALVLILPLSYNFIFYTKFKQIAIKYNFDLYISIIVIINIGVIAIIGRLHVYAHSARHSQWESSHRPIATNSTRVEPRTNRIETQDVDGVKQLEASEA